MSGALLAASAQASQCPRAGDLWVAGRLPGPLLLKALAVLLVGVFLFAAGQGAYGLPLSELPQVLWGAAFGHGERGAAELVFFNIRLPRLLLGVAAGAGLGLAGALMQGLFRNPLADPGLIGMSSGGAGRWSGDRVGRFVVSRSAALAGELDAGADGVWRRPGGDAVDPHPGARQRGTHGWGSCCWPVSR